MSGGVSLTQPTQEPVFDHDARDIRTLKKLPRTRITYPVRLGAAENPSSDSQAQTLVGWADGRAEPICHEIQAPEERCYSYSCF